MDGDVLFDRDGVQSSHSSEILKDKFRDVSKATVEDDNQNNSMSMRSYGKEQDESSDAMISDDDEGEEEEAEESAIEDGLIEVQVEDILGEFQGYANDNVSLFYSVFFVALLWIFYEETVVAKEYGIKQSDFIFYLYF